jgi:hypothetical protein
LLRASGGAGALSALARGAWIAAAFGMTVCVGAADYLTGTDVSLILLYLAPIGFCTWFVTLRGGIALSIGGALVATAADTLYRLDSGGRALPFAVLGWNAVIQLGTSLALVLVLNALRVRLEAESCSPAPMRSRASRTGGRSSRRPRSSSSARAGTAARSRSRTWTPTTSRT